MEVLKKLHKTLGQRKRPEDVAQMVLDILEGSLTTREINILKKASKGSLKQIFYGYTSMMQEFGSSVGAERQINKAIEIFNLSNQDSVDGKDLKSIEKFIETVSPLINKTVGENDFSSDRLNREQRKELGLDLSKRNYNKKWRLLKRLENKLKKYSQETKKIEFQKVGKHGLSHTLTYNEFKKDINSACFIAYYNARCNLRSQFTNTSQERAFDEISEMLFQRCKGIKTPSILDFFKTETFTIIKTTTNWWAIAHIYSNKEVLDKLTDKQKGMLLGKWTNILHEISLFLKEIWNQNSINRETMIVKRGNDSTTWNNTAGAWNKARDNWINLIYALGMDWVLDEICFGKVLRLMAGDVAQWHRSTGGKLDPNTDVWNKIPFPWEVLHGKEKCNKTVIIRYCKNAGLDPEKSGWIAPRSHGITKFKPTPELVHGVTISNPNLAKILRKNKYFRGKTIHFSPRKSY